MGLEQHGICPCICTICSFARAAAGQLVQSLGGGADSNNAFVALFCVTNAMGRLAFGFLPERSMHYFGTPRCASSCVTLHIAMQLR